LQAANEKSNEKPLYRNLAEKRLSKRQKRLSAVEICTVFCTASANMQARRRYIRSPGKRKRQNDVCKYKRLSVTARFYA